METERLREFIALAKHGKLAPAARELFISPSTLSDHIIALENELGGTLFERAGSFSLTGAGEEVLERAQRVLMEYEAMQRACSAGRGTAAVLSMPNYAFGLKPFRSVKRRFLAAHPDLNITFKTKELEMADPFAIIADGLVDVACLYTVPGSGQDVGAMVPNGLSHACVGSCAVVVLTACAHPLAPKRVLDAADLDGETFLTTLCPLADTTARGYQAALAARGSHISIMYRKLDHHDDVLAADLGTYLLFRMVGAENCVGAYGDDMVVHELNFPLCTEVHLVWDEARLDDVQRAFMAYICDAAMRGESLL